MNNDDFIRKEREADEKRKKKLLKERGPRIPFDKFKGRVKGTLSREKMTGAGERVRGAILKAATYEPSEETKEAVYEVGRTVRAEFQEASNYYTGGRKGRRERSSRGEYPSVDDYYAQRGVEAYADAFAPQSLRIDAQGRSTGRRYDTDAPTRVVEEAVEITLPETDDIGFQNPYEEYLANFDPFSQASKSNGKKRKSDDIIARWFET